MNTTIQSNGSVGTPKEYNQSILNSRVTSHSHNDKIHRISPIKPLLIDNKGGKKPVNS